MDNSVGSALLKWIYTDNISQDQLTVQLLEAACKFQLTDLVEKCEDYLIGTATVQDCVTLYTTAKELGVEKLMDYCSSLISTHWVNTLYF